MATQSLFVEHPCAHQCSHGHGFLALGKSFQVQHDWVHAFSVFHQQRNHARELIPKLKKWFLSASVDPNWIATTAQYPLLQCYPIRNQSEMVSRDDLHSVFPSPFQIRRSSLCETKQCSLHHRHRVGTLLWPTPGI
jgi:hypothetical protein